MIESFGNIRKSAFLLKDYLSRNIIGSNLKEIKFLMETYASPAAIKKRSILLQNIISHAIATTPYYRQFKSRNSIFDFPVINKSLIKHNFDDFRSESYKNEPVFKMTTSGSTGTPFIVYQNFNKKNRNYADTLYFARMAGYEIGHTLYYLKIWSENNKKAKLQAWQQNIKPVDVLRLDDAVIAGLIRNIERGKSCKGLLGYASAFDVIVQYLIKTESLPVKGNIRSAIAISESLNPFTRQEMSRYFNTNVVSRYSNLENGILAQQCINSEEFHVNVASYYLEIFDLNKDLPVEPGTLGRIIVTDLFNYAMPMIRYDTGDIGIFSNDTECYIKSPCLTRVEGRKLDLLYDTNGNLISSYIVYKNMWKYPEIIQYQLIQEGEKAYRFIININGIFTREKILVEEFKTYLGAAADFKVEYVSEIPLLSSGKRKKIINNYIKPGT
jgi:phenylacetate-CoA ligase